jgi:hypothetical protein
MFAAASNAQEPACTSALGQRFNIDAKMPLHAIAGGEVER